MANCSYAQLLEVIDFVLKPLYDEPETKDTEKKNQVNLEL